MACSRNALLVFAILGLLALAFAQELAEPELKASIQSRGKKKKHVYKETEYDKEPEKSKNYDDEENQEYYAAKVDDPEDKEDKADSSDSEDGADKPVKAVKAVKQKRGEPKFSDDDDDKEPSSSKYTEDKEDKQPEEKPKAKCCRPKPFDWALAEKIASVRVDPANASLETVGGNIVYLAELVDNEGHVGSVAWTGTVYLKKGITTEANYVVTFKLEHDDYHGTIVAAGVGGGVDSTADVTLAVVGGTEFYEGATGHIVWKGRVSPTEDNPIKYLFRLKLWPLKKRSTGHYVE